MSAFIFDINAKQIASIASPKIQIVSDRCQDIPDAELTFPRSMKIYPQVGGYFIVDGYEMVFRIQEVAEEWEEATSERVLRIAGQEFFAWLLSTRIAPDTIVPTEGETISEFITRLLRSSFIPPSTRYFVGTVTTSLSEEAQTVIESGDSIMEYLMDYVAELNYAARFRSSFSATGYPITGRLEIAAPSEQKDIRIPSPEVTEASITRSERDWTEKIYKMSGFMDGQYGGQGFDYGPFISNFQYTPIDQPPLYSSIGIIMQSGDSYDIGSELTLKAVQRMIWKDIAPDVTSWIVKADSRERVFFSTNALISAGERDDIPALIIPVISDLAGTILSGLYSGYDAIYPDGSTGGKYKVKTLQPGGVADSRKWYKGRGWVTQYVIYDSSLEDVKTPTIPESKRWICVSDILSEYDGTSYSVEETPAMMRTPILISAMEMMIASGFPRRSPAVELDVTLSQEGDFKAGQGLWCTMAGTPYHCIVASMTETKESGQTTKDIELSEWKDDTEPEVDD